MRPWWLASALALSLVPAASLAADQTAICPAPLNSFGFAPPLDRPMLLTVTTERPLKDGTVQRFSLRYRLQFMESGRALKIVSTLEALDGPAGGGSGAAMAAMLTPMVGRTVEYLISADGQNLLLDNGDALWTAMERDMLDQTAGTDRGEARQIAGLLTRLPPAQREQLLSADLRHMLRFAGRGWSPDYQLQDGPPTGDCTDVAIKQQELPGTLRADRRWRVDRRTGLVREQMEDQWQSVEGQSAPLLAARSRRTLALEN